MVQPDMKKLVAYSSVSHLGFVVLGICAMNVQGVQGAVYQMLAHGVSTGGLFLIVGMLSDRRHTRLISEFGGLKEVMPRLTAAFLIITLASIGMPALNGFVGEFLTMLGAFRWDPRYVACGRPGRDSVGRLHALDVPARVLRRVTNEKNATLRTLQPREWARVFPLFAMAILMGVVSHALPEADGAGGRAWSSASRRASAVQAAPHAGTVRRPTPNDPDRRPQTDDRQPGPSDDDMSSISDAIVPMLCVTAGRLAGDDGRGVPRARRAHADRRPRHRRPVGAARLVGRSCGTATPRASASSSPTTSGCS